MQFPQTGVKIKATGESKFYDNSDSKSAKSRLLAFYFPNKTQCGRKTVIISVKQHFWSVKLVGKFADNCMEK